MTIVAIETPTLGDRGYLAHDGEVALVVDAQRDIDRVLLVAGAEGVRITHVFETHIHNDYVTGGYALARATGAAYHVNAADPVTFDRVPVRDGDTVEVGERLRVRVLGTPGHTFTHLSYALYDGDDPVGVFTGGSLIYGSVGRPDLLGPEHTHDLARHQHASARRLAAELPGATEVFPTHGFGSFCSVDQSAVTESTLAREGLVNPVFTTGAEAFVESVLAQLDAWPAYYGRLGPVNLAGPDAPDLTPPAVAGAEELRARLAAGEWVVDLRHRVAFAAGHAPGTVNLGLDGNVATYLGWLIDWGAPVTLLAGTADEIARAQRELVRVGIDRPAAQAVGGPRDWAGGAPLGTYPRMGFADLAQVRHHRPVVVLDVRRDLEHNEEHLPGSVHVPLHELRARLAGIPDGEVWVHCTTGYRAAIAASLLAAAGRRVVLVDDDFPAGTFGLLGTAVRHGTNEQ
ncbi:MBL fold metallo-hydrolase [Luedemannella helvata]|uniref:MBL fold metallo-hydrolase n=1 Tax=Luedemannella helvata TaxID=349315 RepID=A0ABN2L082_9ACTN